MTQRSDEFVRRNILKAFSIITIAPAVSSSASAAQTTQSVGGPGDFEFLSGEWAIRNRRSKKDGSVDEFDSEATVFSILGGVCSVEELRIPARGFSGLGLRLLDVEKRVWTDFWVNAKSGVLTTPGATGVFINGVGEFAGDDAGEPIRAKGVWDMITPTSCRWRQLLSEDGGRTWFEDWAMAWTRV